jgi:hypothetical protein
VYFYCAACPPANDSAAKVEVDITVVSDIVVFGYVCDYRVRLGCGGRGEEHVINICGCDCLSLETSADVNAPVGFYMPETNGFQLQVEVQVPLVTRLSEAVHPFIGASIRNPLYQVCACRFPH